MVIGKEKFALWITPEAKKEVEAHYALPGLAERVVPE